MSPQAKDHEVCVFSQVRDQDVGVGFSSNGSLDVGSSGNICMDGLGVAFQKEVGLGQKAYVDEVSSGTTVNEGGGFDNLSSGSQSDGETNSSFIGQSY